jgi:hypothetical protein
MMEAYFAELGRQDLAEYCTPADLIEAVANVLAAAASAAETSKAELLALVEQLYECWMRGGIGAEGWPSLQQGADQSRPLELTRSAARALVSAAVAAKLGPARRCECWSRKP